MRGLLWIPALVGAAMLIAALDGTSGIGTALELHEELRAAHARIEAARAESERLRREAAALEGDGFAIERAIREDLGLARAGETLVRMSRADSSSLRIR